MSWGETELQLIKELRNLADKEPAYNLEYVFANKFALLTGRPEGEVLGVLRDLSKRQTTDAYGHAARYAADRLLYWFEHASEWNTDDMITFIASHDPACVYAVLVGQRMQQ